MVALNGGSACVWQDWSPMVRPAEDLAFGDRSAA
jgi:hypothetical protein